jgi:hypothetical protein
MAWTREQFSSNLDIKRLSKADSDGGTVSVILQGNIPSMPTNNSSSEQLSYPGQFKWTEMNLTDFNDADIASFNTTRVNTIWFRDTASTTT